MATDLERYSKAVVLFRRGLDEPLYRDALVAALDCLEDELNARRDARKRPSASAGTHIIIGSQDHGHYDPQLYVGEKQ